jgi:sugar (pentulose or hexulose) kinase
MTLCLLPKVGANESQTSISRTMTSKIGGNVWLGLDLGTQSVRAVAVSDTGQVLGKGSHPVVSWREGPRHEQDPEEWWRALVYALRKVFSTLPTPVIRAVALDGTSGSVLLVNHWGHAVTAGVMYDDTRAVEEASLVNQVGSATWAALGYHMQPSWALPKLLWLLRQHRGQIPALRLAHQADFINRRLAGQEIPSDSSNALKTGYDLVRENWPYEVLDALEVPRQMMPAVVRPGTPIGTICTRAAAETGIPAGTPIIAGMTDGCAAQIAAGALEMGSWNSVLGTTLVVKGVTRELMHDPAGVLYSHRSPDGLWLPGGASSIGAGVLTKYFPGRNLDELSAQAAACEPASIIAYPLVSQGERFPFIAPEAQGFVLGTPADEIDLFAALLQGVGFVERLCFDYLDLLGAPTEGDLRFTGGAAHNPYWCQLRADILERSVCLLEDSEAALGMAVLAASVGRRVADVAKEMIRVRKVIAPRPDRVGRFRQPYIRLVRELSRRGWVQSALVEHAVRRATQ